jgi:4a-hydroxytetrahydrobiopterin dehydratase
MPVPLSDEEIAARLASRPRWMREGNALVRVYEHTDFTGSIAFVNVVAETANALNHHPDITVSWNMVTIRTWSHDAGGITDRDFSLADQIDAH